MKESIERLAEIAGTIDRKPTRDETAEAIGIAIGLVGSLVVSFDRIASAFERHVEITVDGKPTD